MRRLKIFMDQKNYMCIGNMHIFINFNHDNFEYITSINPRSVQTIHVFITTHAAINNDLKMLIGKYKKFVVDGQEYRSKIVIHLPRRIKELKTLIEKFLGPEYVVDNGYILIAERKGPRFMLDSYPDCFEYIDNWLNIIYDKSSIKITMTREPGHPKKHVLYGRGGYPISIKFPEYPYNVIDKDNDPGIFETAEMRLEPEMFKDKLIAGFKENCPEGILKSFKTDEDIWDYIMEQGTWSQKDTPDTNENKSDAKVAIIACGQPSMARQLSELIRDGKVIIADEMPAYPPIPKIELPKPIQFPEHEFDVPINRAERRAAKKGGRRI